MLFRQLGRALVAVVCSVAALAPARQGRVRLGATPIEAAAEVEQKAEPPTVVPKEGPKPMVLKSSLKSAGGVDYAPLAEALRLGDFREADQITRDKLIEAAGPQAVARGYVYWTEARVLPAEDLATMELLWNHYSDNKFGFSIQARLWKQLGANFEKFCKKIEWTVADADTGLDRKRRWFGSSEFFYDTDAACRGHLPLTSALRGTQLLKSLMNHKIWANDNWKRDLEFE